MLRSSANNRAAAKRSWVRRLHRWLGITALAFVLLLATTGIALNHGDAWRLDERYLDWGWVLAAYGMNAPAPDASFADGGHRATLLGGRLYFNGVEIARDVASLAGVVYAGEIVVVAVDTEAFLLTPDGALVERMALDGRLSAAIEALGRAGQRVVLSSGGKLWRFDAALANVEPWPESAAADVRWSAATPVAADQLAAIRDLYRGRGVSVERLLADLHSGRIFTRLGALVMDAVGVLLILLALTGLVLWRPRAGNGQRAGRR
jgi:hypothetical protein